MSRVYYCILRAMRCIEFIVVFLRDIMYRVYYCIPRAMRCLELQLETKTRNRGLQLPSSQGALLRRRDRNTV